MEQRTDADICSPPPHLSERAQVCWSEITDLHPGLLAQDRLFVEYASRALAELRDSTKVDPKLGLRLEAIFAQLRALAAQRLLEDQLLGPRRRDTQA